MPKTVNKVLYVVSKFPSVSATFTAYEMAAIQALGTDVHVASVWNSDDPDRPHDVEKPFLDKIFHLRLSNPAVWGRAIQQLAQKPALFGVLYQLFVGHLVSIYALLKLLAGIPKGLYLGYLIKQHGFDFIHAHFLTSPTTVALIASKVSGVPYSVTIHAIDIFGTDPKVVNGGVEVKCENAAANVVISDFNRRYILERWPGVEARFEIIYNGVDLSLYDNTVPKKTFDDTTYRILSNGRLIEKKGHDYLIRAFAKLLQDGLDAQLSIIGNGPLMDNLQALTKELGVTDRVHFLGRMSQAEVVENYRSCDLFALACAVAPNGDMDGLPTVLIESLALEVPSISTQVTGVPEIIIDNETGLCVPPHDVDAFHGALKQMIDNPADAERMAQAGRKLVVEKFDRYKNAETLLSLWNELVESR